MILFYDKRDGKVFATTDGRVHNQKRLKCFVNDGRGKKNIGKFIIGWEELDETEDKTIIVEELVEVEKGLFKKEKVERIIKVTKKIEHNLDQFELLQKFEDISPENPLEYKVDLKTNKLVKVDNKD